MVEPRRPASQLGQQHPPARMLRGDALPWRRRTNDGEKTFLEPRGGKARARSGGHLIRIVPQSSVDEQSSAIGMQCRHCSGTLCEVTDICFSEKTEKEVHLTLRPQQAVPDSVLISETCDQKGIAHANCGSCSSRAGYQQPFGPGCKYFVAFGSDTVKLFGECLGREARWVQLRDKLQFVSIECHHKAHLSSAISQRQKPRIQL